VTFPSDQGQDFSKAFLISIFGKQFGNANSIDLVQLDGKICSPSLWVSDSSLFCSISSLLFESNRVEVGFKSDKTFEVPRTCASTLLVIDHQFLFLIFVIRFLWLSFH
jgi:hypothetical protein